MNQTQLHASWGNKNSLLLGWVTNLRLEDLAHRNYILLSTPNGDVQLRTSTYSYEIADHMMNRMSNEELACHKDTHHIPPDARHTLHLERHTQRFRWDILEVASIEEYEKLFDADWFDPRYDGVDASEICIYGSDNFTMPVSALTHPTLAVSQAVRSATTSLEYATATMKKFKSGENDDWASQAHSLFFPPITA
jgi:hypothetical protein